MSKHLPAEYCQKNKERLQKLVKDIKIFLRKKNKKSFRTQKVKTF